MRPLLKRNHDLSNKVMRERAPGRTAKVQSVPYCRPASLIGLCLLAAAGFCLPVSAQQVTQSDLPLSFGNNVVSGSAPIESQYDAVNNRQSDVLFGRNVKGPYLLSWKNVRANSEVVQRDGQLMRRDADYTFDADAGTITFTTPLRGEQLARVAYRCDTPNAARNAVAPSAPLQFDLWQQGQNRVSLRALYRPDSSGKTTTGGVASTSLNYLGGWKLSSTSSLNSNLYMGIGSGNIWDNTGMQLSERTKLKTADFGIAYSRAGTQFAQEDATGLKAGREVFEANGALTPLQNLKFNALWRLTNALPDTAKGDKGAQTQETGASLALDLKQAQTKIEAGRSQTTLTPTGAAAVVQTQDKVQVEKGLGKTTQANLTYETQASDPTDGSAKTYTQRTGVGFKTRPDERVTLSGNFSNSIGTSGGTDIAGLKLESNPFLKMKQLRLLGTWEDRFQADGVRRTREALLELPKFGFGQTLITGGVRQTSLPGKEQFVGLVNGATRPLRYLEVTGGAQFRDGTLNGVAPDPDSVDSYNVKFALSPLKRLRVTGSVGMNPESSDGKHPPSPYSRPRPGNGSRVPETARTVRHRGRVYEAEFAQYAGTRPGYAPLTLRYADDELPGPLQI